MKTRSPYRRWDHFSQYKFLDKIILNNVLLIYYDKEKTLIEIAEKCKISFETLNKLIKFNKLPKVKRVGKIIDRQKSYEKMFKTKFGLTYDEYLLTKPDFERYKSRVKYYTNKTIKKWGILIGNLKDVKQGKNGHHIDHITSIKDCYMANIEPYIVADIINLRAIPSTENLSKGSKSLVSPEILKLNVLECENNKIKLNDITWNFS